MVKISENESINDESEINTFFKDEFQNLLTNKSNSNSISDSSMQKFLNESCSDLSKNIKTESSHNSSLEVTPFEVKK